MRKSNITIATIKGPVTVPGYAGDSLAVTPQLNGAYMHVRGRWNITHIKTGMAVYMSVKLNLKQAKKLVPILEARYPFDKIDETGKVNDGDFPGLKQFMRDNR